MLKKKSVRRDGKMIHVRLDEKLHKKLKIKVAKNDLTIQEWVYQVIENELLNKKK